ncbi:Outer membrane protein, OmpA/MotB family [Candidatus Glomeribacter gigasporarum BEG34]|uniref:Outer membrane protein, OmpA/MotB family n=1 Tax=Candidatus Glomeribacter gigasporarum BEG34 TaxID=1070319 RepID=G2J937_9BURK|nr:OmpA family protein [Candidatus Glomeribacter gigasporarum]CCD29284.1 Outer membrane protein, OmpA/MotB family [Candidatus Glomeribacter gigasporarum BEG34]
MKRTLISTACALALCATHATARDTLGITDPTVLQRGFGAEQSFEAGAPDRVWFDKYGTSVPAGSISAMQQRWDALKAKYPDAAYFSAKAQCWIDAARAERAVRNQWGFVQEALGEADRLISAMEGGRSPELSNPPLRTVRQVRPDLWTKIQQLQQDPKMRDCLPAQRTLACTEVVLSHAGHEAWSRLFSAAEKRVATAEQMLQQAEQELQSCTPPAPPPPSPITSQKVKYQAETLFDFDKSMLKPEGRAKLDDLAAKIKGIDLEVIVATGHTDRIGTDKYNDGLSARRAQAVKAYLVHRGIDAKRTYTEAKGKRNPVTTGCNQNLKTQRQALIACLAPDRRVEVEVVGTKSASE